MSQHTGRVMTRAEYDREVELGLIEEDEKIELLAGRIVDVSPEGSPHYATIAALVKALHVGLSAESWEVRFPGPVALSDRDEPEPDVCVARARPDGYFNSHPEPSELVLVIEVANSSRRRDLVLKAERYALAGIEDYWVVDLVEGVTVVHRAPVTSSGEYRSVVAVPAGEVVTPLAFPDLELQPHLRLPAGE